MKPCNGDRAIGEIGDLQSTTAVYPGELRCWVCFMAVCLTQRIGRSLFFGQPILSSDVEQRWRSAVMIERPLLSHGEQF
jgi:hypothetical protein